MYLRSYPRKFSASRGFRALPRCFIQSLGRSMASFLPLCRSVFPSARRSWAFDAVSNVSIRPATSLALTRHLKRLSPQRPAFARMSLVDPKAIHKSASLKLSRPFAFLKNRNPSFHSWVSEASGKRCPAFPEGSLSGLATRSMSLSSPDPPGSLFQLPTRWGFSLQSFAPSR